MPTRPAAAVTLLLLAASTLASPAPATAAEWEPYVVIAIVDTGVNPYHEAFRAPPGTDYAARVPGFPGATPIHLALDAPTYDEAVEKDRPTWEALKDGVLYTFPGTRVLGAYRAPGGVSATNTAPDRFPLLDDDGHGTLTAALAAGEPYGACPRCLLVIVEGFDGLEWATRQRWIDVVSNSWGSLGNLGTPLLNLELTPRWTRYGAERAQTLLFAAGNGYANAFLTPQTTWTSGSNGPDWVVNVGAYRQSGDARLTILGTGKPVDVLANGWNVPSADPFSLTGEAHHSGTSAATPIAAGVLAQTLLNARAALHDDRPGQRAHGGHWIAASGNPVPTSPYLNDGALTRQELWDATFATARPTSGRVGIYPPSLPHTDTFADAPHEGYGTLTPATAHHATRVLLGHAPRPDRADVDLWMQWDAFIRDTLWGNWDRDADGRPDPHAQPGPVLP